MWCNIFRFCVFQAACQLKAPAPSRTPSPKPSCLWRKCTGRSPSLRNWTTTTSSNWWRSVSDEDLGAGWCAQWRNSPGKIKTLKRICDRNTQQMCHWWMITAGKVNCRGYVDFCSSWRWVELSWLPNRHEQVQPQQQESQESVWTRWYANKTISGNNNSLENKKSLKIKKKWIALAGAGWSWWRRTPHG